MLPPPSAEAVASTEALPVRLHLRGSHAGAVERWVLSVGWQPITDEVTIRPALTLIDVPAALEGAQDTGAAVLLVGDDRPEAAATAALRVDASEAVRWPEGRSELPEVAARVIDQRVPGRVEDLRVAGGSGGVGTTTVAFGLAGLRAWQGRRTLLLRSPGPSPGRDDRHGELEGATAWRAAAALPGVRRLRSLGVPDPSVPLAGGPADLVVRDLGVSRDTDVLVVRRDRAGLDAVAATTAAVIVVSDDGPATLGALRAAASGRRTVVVPWSARVARTGLRGRLPAGLPGSWLRTLARVLGREVRR